MGTWIVERYLAGWEHREIEDLVERILGRRETFEAYGVQHLRSITIAEDESCLCLFNGPDADSVRAANTAGDFPVHRIVAADETTPDLEASRE